uniref:Uncharacterized protein n=1 Tax=Corethrella appendiculata TaxID=1370023 RepID=U5ELY1_9DIPT
MGWSLINTVIQVLLYSPNQSNGLAHSGHETMSINSFTYSLWFLEPHVRKNWLMSLLVILYKYQYTLPPLSEHVQNLIRIVINTLEAQFHQCRRIPVTVILDSHMNRSRDLSQPSVGPDQENNKESPPVSPFPEPLHSGKTVTNTSTPGFRKYPDSSFENDDTESELVAIPESDFSDSTLQGSSAPGSFDDTVHFDDISTPLRTEIDKHKAFTTSDINKCTNIITDEQINNNLKIISTTNFTSKVDSQVLCTSNANDYASLPKCSVQEGVRMMVTSSMLGQPKAQAILNPQSIGPRTTNPVIQNIISNKYSTKTVTASKMAVSITPGQLKTLTAVQINEKGIVNVSEGRQAQDKSQALISSNGISINWKEHRSLSPLQKTIGRQQRIIVPSLTPASTPISNSETPLSVSDPQKLVIHKKHQIKNIEKNTYASPESPLSKMNIMSPPSTVNTDYLSPKLIAELEIPTLERLLPIGQHGKEGISALVDKVREALAIPNFNDLEQHSFDKSDNVGEEPLLNICASSPRKLIKQVALESPPNQINSDDVHASLIRSISHDVKFSSRSQDETGRQFHKQKMRKIGPFSVGSIGTTEIRNKHAGSWAPNINIKQDEFDVEGDTKPGNQTNLDLKQSLYRVGDESVCDRCGDCGAIIEEYTDEEIGILLIVLGTFIHREPTLAAPFLPEIMTIVAKISQHFTFPWQFESTTHLPGGSQSVAHQFIRCVLHQLTPNGVFYQIFLTQAIESTRKIFFRSINQSLIDFAELNPTSPVQLLIESLNSKKTLPIDVLPIILRNLSEYLQCVPNDIISGTTWSITIQGIDTLFRRIILILPSLDEAENLLYIMVSVFKVPQLTKNILDPFSKVLSYSIQNLNLNHKILIDLCYFNIRAFSKERDKLAMCRQIVFELVQALKFKTNIPDGNLLLLIGLLLQDAGGALPHNIEDLPDTPSMFNNNLAECMRQYLNDVLEFLADFHTLSKIKNFKNGVLSSGLSEDTLGGVLKGAVAQYLSLEMSRGNSRDNRAVARYLPWLYNVPSSLQQGPKEFTECVGHMRILSWLLMGSLTYTALTAKRGGAIGQHGAAVHYHLQQPVQTTNQPVPQEASCHIADHIQVIFAGFAEQSKTSVLHMSSLFHAFTLCQLWTVYLEQLSCTSPPSSESYNITMGILFEFWAKVTPCILQLVSHSKLSEMVNLHFLSLLEALKETQSTVLAKLLPLWSSVLSSHTQLSGTLHVRLQNCRDIAPSVYEQDLHQSEALLKWLQRLQFKMGQIELQSSTAIQFYSI